MAIVKVRRDPGGRDTYGDPVDSTTERTTLTGCRFAPGSSTATAGRGRDGIVSTPALYCRTDPDLAHTDQVEVDGRLYDVDGEPEQWGAGVVVQLRSASG